MSNRLEWREISTQGINPNEGLRTYMSGLQNAHAATNTMRENQRVDDQQIIANDFKQQYMDILSKGKEGKASAYDKLALENYTTQHFEQGGTLETLGGDKDFRNIFDTTNPKVMEDILASRGRYDGRRKNEYDADIKLLDDKRDSAKAALPTDLSEDGLKAAVDQIDLEYNNARIGLDDLFNRGVSTRSMKQNQQLTGTAVSNRNSDGSVERPSLSRVKAVDTLRDSVIKDTDQRKAELEQQLEGGMSLEDYNIQMGQLESYRDTNLKQIDDDANKSNIKSFTGATVGVDYSISSSGSLVVGGKDVPERVGNALRQAAELTGQPLDIILPFVSNESSFNPNAVSKTGVKGLMQVTGATADEVYARNKDVFANAGLTYDPNDRTNPETSALLGALYIGEIRQKLGNDAPMEMVYMAYNLGPNDKLLDPSHNKNTPIDQLVPVSAGKISVGLKNNKSVYQNKDGTWKTLNQAAEEIRRRAGVSDIVLSDPAATIEQRVTAENRENKIKVRGESALVNYTTKDFSDKTDSTLRAANDIVNPYIPTPVVEGKDVKPVSKLSKGEIESMLAGAGIDGLSEKTAGKLFQKIAKNPTLKDLNSDQIGMLLSWTPKGNYFADIDDVGLDRNIEIIKTVWKDNEKALKLNMDDAILAKKLMGEFQSKANPLKDAIRNSERVIRETGLKLEDDTLTEPQERAYNLEITTHRERMEKNKNSLNFHSNFTAERVNPLLNNIATFTKKMEDTYANEGARLAQVKIEEIASNPNTASPKLSYLYGLIAAGPKGHADFRRANMEDVEREVSDTRNQFTGNPFKDYAAGKRLAEGKNK